MEKALIEKKLDFSIILRRKQEKCPCFSSVKNFISNPPEELKRARISINISLFIALKPILRRGSNLRHSYVGFVRPLRCQQ